MAQGRPSRGESFTENLQDYVEESIQNSANLPDTGAMRDLSQSDPGMSRPQAGQIPTTQSTAADGTTSITPDTEAALEEHLAATESVSGTGQSDTANAGAADLTSAAVQNEARTRITDRTNDELGMGSIRR